MKTLLSIFLILILSACGDSESDTNKSDNPNIEPIVTNHLFPYGIYQSMCQSFGIFTNIPAYNDFGVILTEEYNENSKTFIQNEYVYEKVGSNLCSIPMFKLSYFSSFEEISYNSDRDLYMVKLTFIRSTATPGSETVATNWNNNNYSGINTWIDRVERDVTGKNPDGSSFVPSTTSYKIISLTNGNTQLIQNENENGYPTSLDYGYVFYKRD